MVRSGLLDLGQWQATGFALDDANGVVSRAAVHGGPFELDVIRPEALPAPPLLTPACDNR